MQLNYEIRYIQVKSPIKIDKYHLKSLQIPVKELCKSREQVKKNKVCKTVSNLFWDFPHPVPASCVNQSAEFWYNSTNWFQQSVRQ